MKNSFLRDLRPANAWEECYPLGNGVIGVMDDGNLQNEHMYLNDAFLWSGYEGMQKWRKDGGVSLKKARELFLEGKVKEAEDVIYKNICGDFCEGYMPLGTITLTSDIKKSRKNYERILSLTDSLHTVRFSNKDGNIEEKSFVSHPDSCYVKERVSAYKINSKIEVTNELKHTVKVVDSAVIIKGLAPSRVYPHYYTNPGGNIIYDEHLGQEFAYVVKIDTDGQLLETAKGFEIKEYKYLRLTVMSAVSKVVDENALYERVCKCAKKSFQEIFDAHRADYQALFSRVDFKVNDIENSPLVTREAIKKYERGVEDPALIVTEFDYGRYLLISSSRENSPATNLQGIWNDSVQPPWNTHHTININTEMNYWCAEITDLHECFIPLVDFTEKIMKTGEIVAKETFGMKGWCLNHNSDFWGSANPVGGESKTSPMSYAYFVSGGGWLCSTLYESALIYDKKEYYERLFPIIRGSAEFYLDYLEDYQGFRVPLLATSPENAYYKGKTRCYLDAYTTIEVSIIRDVFTALIDIYQKLGFGQPDNVVEESKIALSKLPPYKLGHDGRILEYSEDYPETEVKHRHTSHLYGLYPSCQITENDPALFEGAKRVIKRRGLYGTGWSLSWKLCMSARLLEGKYTKTLLRHYNHLVKPDGKGRGGCYSSLLCAHPPFQIDGNFGLTAGIAEMLVAVLEGKATLSELFPDSFKKIEVKGLKQNGNKSVGGTATR